jgi:two-component system response regulator AtoC
MATDDGEESRLPGATTTPFLEAPRLLGDRHRLLVWLGDSVSSWPLPKSGTVMVGRSAEVEIQIPSPMVSRQHARIVVGPTQVCLLDDRSQNGVRVNGERIIGGRLLAYGDIISFGDVTAAFVEDRGDRPTGRPESPSPLGQEIELGDRTVLVADPAMITLYGQLELLAPSELSVMVLGETGTGKELAAHALHFWSKRRSKPLVTINCASLPEALAESELFGHERGAFSGAVQAKPGLLEAAGGGTVFLDEIGDMSLAVQAKLLRVLEARRVTRLGSIQERPIDIRVVAATHRNLVEEVKVGRFREDLFYRLGAAVVRVPPLRARLAEVPLLARTFLDQARRALGRPPLAFSSAATALLEGHTWPGNVRELKNVAEYLAATVMESAVTPVHIGERLAVTTAVERVMTPAAPFSNAAEGASRPPAGPSRTVDAVPLADANRQFERERIETALAATRGNKTQAARLLGVPLRTFMEKVKRHGLG